MISFYDIEEKEQDAMWEKPDSQLQTPLFHAAKNANYQILEWRLSEMSESQRAKFFASVNKAGRGPIEELMTIGGSATKNDLKALNVMVSHLTSSYEKKVFLQIIELFLSLY